MHGIGFAFPAAVQRDGLGKEPNHMVWNAIGNDGGWGTWRELSELHAQFDRFFGGTPRRSTGGTPPIELWNHDGGVRFYAQMPGVAADAIEVSVEGDTLMLKGARKEPDARSFARSVRLPFAVDASGVTARVENGILEVELPRAPSEMPRKIAVKTA
jgi:HSP20 family protein